MFAARAQGEARGTSGAPVHVRRVILLLRGETTLRAYALPRQLLLRTAGRLALLFYSLLVYMLWFMQVYSSV